jgi:hypothetical protein
MVLQLVMSQQKSIATNINGADVYVQDASDFKVQYLLGEQAIVNAVQDLVKVTRDTRSLDWISNNNNPAALFRIKITITCCQPFTITVEF